MSPSGNDSNPGTLAAPWKTMDRLQKARSSLRPGDTVYFRGGDYVTDRYISFNRDGTSSAPITYKAYQGETPTIVYNAPPKAGTGVAGPAFFMSGDYNVFDGINFRLPEDVRRRVMIDNVFFAPGGRANINAVSGLGVYGDNVIVRNCHIDNFSQNPFWVGARNVLVEYCRMTNNASHNFYVSGAGGTYRYNVLDGSRAFGNQQGFQMQYDGTNNNKVYGNLVINGQATGVTMSGRLSNNEVFNNVFINPGAKRRTSPCTDTNAGACGGHSWAISFWCEDGPIGSGNKIYNNTFIGVSANGLIMPGACTRNDNGQQLGRNVQIYNNIFYPSTPVPVGLNLSNIRNNIFYNITSSVPAGNTLVDPKLVNPNGSTAADAALLPNSPAIDAGRNSSFPADDYDRKPRPAGTAYDIGAFEGGSMPRICSVPGTAVAVPTSVIDPSTGQPPTRPGYVLVGAVPAGFTLSAGTVEKTVPEGTVYRLSLAQLSGLTLTPPADFRGTVKIEAFFVPQ